MGCDTLTHQTPGPNDTLHDRTKGHASAPLPNQALEMPQMRRKRIPQLASQVIPATPFTIG